MSNTVRLHKGSGFDITYSSPDGNGYYSSDTLDRSALQFVSSGHWREVQPDGFELHFEGSSVAAPPAPTAGVGCVGNLLGRGYAAPFVGAPLRIVDPDGLNRQPPLCRLDQEFMHGYEVPAAGVYGMAGLARPEQSLSGAGNLLDRVVALISRVAEPFDLAAGTTGGDCGIAGLTCRFHHGSGNLLLTFSLPDAGPTHPPIRFFYNSLLASQTEFGYGWSCLWQQRLEDTDPETASGTYPLARLVGPSGATWTVERSAGLIDYILDPLDNAVLFEYDAGLLTGVTDAAGRVSAFSFDTAGNLTHLDVVGTATVGFQYDGSRLLTAVSAADGKLTHFGYDGSRRLTSITTPSAALTQIVYTSSTVRTVTDPRSKVWTMRVTGDLLVDEVVTPIGTTLGYSWAGASQRLTGFTDGRGAATSFAYDSMNDYSSRLIEISRPYGQLYCNYDYAAGDLSAVVDERGVQWGLTWAGHQRTTFAQAGGGSISYAYGSLGQTTGAIDARGGTWTWGYDGVARMTAATNPMGHSRTFAYDSRSQISSITDAEGNVTQYFRDDLHRVTATVDPGLHTATTAYDAAGRVTASVNTLGGTATAAYDAGGRLTQSVGADSSTWTFAYDAASNVTATVDPRGLPSTSAYDDADRQTSHVDPEGGTQTWSYDDADNQTQYVDENNCSWTEQYDDEGRQTSATDPLNNSQYETYDAAGYLLTRVAEDGGESREDYDDPGRATLATDQEGFESTAEYDENDNVTETIRPDGHTTTTQYDAANQPTAVTTSSGTTYFAYDSNGRRTQVVDAENHTEVTKYSWFGSPTEVIDAAGGTRQWAYDAKQRLTLSTDPLGGQTSFAYDAADRRTAMTDDDGRTWTWAYDPSGNLTAQADGRPATASLSYDGKNRLTRTVWSDGQTHTTAYDPVGNATLVVDASGTSTTTYDARRLAVARSVPQKSVTASMAYDSRGLMTTQTAFDAGVFSYAYDARGLQTEVYEPSGSSAIIAYDGMRRVTEQTLGNGGRTTLVYSRDDLTAVEHYDANATLINALSCTYNNVGRRLSQSETDGTTTAWTYDAAYRLTAEQRTRTLTTIFDVAYAYDAGGNRTQAVDGGQTSTYAYSGAGCLTQAIAPGPTTSTFAYDAAGNRTSQTVGADVSTFSFDSRNNLTAAARPSGTSAYGYDARGQVVRRTSPGNVVHQFVYDASGLLERTDNAGSTDQLYVRRSRAGGGGALLSQWSSGTGLVDFQFDAQQCAAMLLSSSGVDGPFRYRALGLNPAGTAAGGETDSNVSISTLTDAGFKGESGTRLDVDAGLHLVAGEGSRATIFDPFTAQYLSPARPSADVVGVYAWSGNDGINRT